MHAIVVHETGGPEQMRWQRADVGSPAADEALVRHTAIGLNFIDVYFRTGLYPPPRLPFTPGMEAAGVVEAVGEDVDTLEPGDRVAYAAAPPGAYCERRLMPAERLVRIPEDVSDEAAAAIMLKGMTAWYLLRRTHRLQAGETILVHAAAGGVGLIVCQWARALGATVIGTVGSPEKAELARAHGCHHPIDYRCERFPERVRAITASPHISPPFVARASRCRCDGGHGPEDGEGVADTTSSRLEGVRRRHSEQIGVRSRRAGRYAG